MLLKSMKKNSPFFIHICVINRKCNVWALICLFLVIFIMERHMIIKYCNDELNEDFDDNFWIIKVA